MTQIAIDGYTVESASFVITRQAKILQYVMPNTDSDLFLPMGSYNRTINLQVKGVSDKDYENIVLLLSKPSNTLVDINGNTYLVKTTNVDTSHIGGQVGYHNLNISFIEATV